MEPADHGCANPGTFEFSDVVSVVGTRPALRTRVRDRDQDRGRGILRCRRDGRLRLSLERSLGSARRPSPGLTPQGRPESL